MATAKNFLRETSELFISHPINKIIFFSLSFAALVKLSTTLQMNVRVVNVTVWRFTHSHAFHFLIAFTTLLADNENEIFLM